MPWITYEMTNNILFVFSFIYCKDPTLLIKLTLNYGTLLAIHKFLNSTGLTTSNHLQIKDTSLSPSNL